MQRVCMGDLNITAKSDAMRTLREEFGLVSTYHVHHKVMPGDEAHPTHDWRRWKTAPWHIDFCLVPEGWAPSVREVFVGT